MPVGTFLFILFIIAMGLVLVSTAANYFGITASGRDRRDRRQLAHKLDRAETLIESVRETAYQHRELDSALSTIICDEISQYYKDERRRELGA